MTLVLDASMTLAWVFEREHASDAAVAANLLGRCGAEPWWVPGVWPLEIANALLVAERRSLLEAATSDTFLGQLNALPISVDEDCTPAHQARVVLLARSQGLSSYDAAYLDLSLRLGATLASFDCRLNRAAAELGVNLYCSGRYP